MPRNNVIEVVGEFADNISEPVKRVGGTIDKLGKLFSLTALAGGTLAGALIVLTKNAADALEEDVKLNKAIKALGEAAGVTAAQVDALGDAIESTTKFSGGSIKIAAASLLLFDRVTGETFNRAIAVSADLAATMGTDVPQAAEALGRALQDPERGLARLRAVGVNFTTDQVALIKTMVDTGRAAEAQGIILDRLAEKTAGAAKASRDTFGGALVSLKNNILGIVDGGGADGPLPVLVDGINALTDAVARFRGIGEKNTALEKLYSELAVAEDNLTRSSGEGTTIIQARIVELSKLIRLEEKRKAAGTGVIERTGAPTRDLTAFDIDAYILANSELTVDIDAQIKERERLQEEAIARGETRAQKAFQSEIDMLVSKGQVSEAVAVENARAIEEIMGGLEDAVAESIPEITDPIEEFTTSLQNAFEGMVRTGQFSMRQLVQFMIAELTRKQLFKAIEGVGEALRDALSSGGKGSGFLKAAGSFLGFAAGGGMGSGARIVGEEGPELLLSPGRVMNRRQLAFAAGGSGGGITYAPQAVFNVNGDPNPQLLAALNAEWERKRRIDQIGFVEMLERNGLGRMR